ncbi:MAG TPA: hypothetical protein VMF04_00575 [Thermoplasmata archaeon]|nr:hypothetical protein [Thermoplasmata archaeon]
MTNEDIGILDLSRIGRSEWTPPIGALGGPPAHELYHDLVVHAGLRLMRDEAGRPVVELQDGEHRRTFVVPSVDLRAALDRFRMRRNLRPVPESDIDEFARVIGARVSDPDVDIPLFRPAPAAVRDEALPGPLTPPTWAVDELDHLMQEVDAIQGRAPEPPADDPEPPGPREFGSHPTLHTRLPHRWHTGVSGARSTEEVTDPRLPRYVRVLRELVQEGAWIGTLTEISRRTGDDTEEVFATLLRFHTDLVGNDLVVAPVEVEEGWRWVVVDRTRVRSDRRFER